MSTIFAVGAGALPVGGEVAPSLLRLSDVGATTYNSADFGNLGARGLHLIVDATAAANSPSVVFTVQGKDPVSGVYYDLLVATAITATGTTALKLYPGITPLAGGAASDCLPQVWRVNAVHAAGATKSLTYSVGAVLLP